MGETFARHWSGTSPSCNDLLINLANGSHRMSHSSNTRVGISGTIAKSRQRKCVPSSHPGPFAVVETSQKSKTKVGTLACFDLL